MAIDDYLDGRGDVVEPTPEEVRGLDGMIRQARRVLDPPRVLSPLEIAIVALLGERFDIVDFPDLTGTTWTARELAESLQAQMEEQGAGT